MRIVFDDIKSFESNHTVSDILSTYIMCSKDSIVQSLIGDGVNTGYSLIYYWSEINKTDIQSILDAIEINLNEIADFSVIGDFTVPVTNIKIIKTVIRLGTDVIIPLEWSL